MNTRTQEPSIAAQVASLRALPMLHLWKLWDRYFPRRPAHANRGYIEGRVAYRLQQEAYGTDCPVRSQLVHIGESLSRIKSRKAVQVHVVPGTILIREYDDREHRVVAQADGVFECEGRRFNSLSAAARHITGGQVSGPVFFGLKGSKSK